MQRKIIALVIFLVGAGIFFLGMLQTNFTCDKSKNKCLLRSSIPALHLNLDSMEFKLTDVDNVECVKRTQASRGSGRRAYYELTLDIKKVPYVIETCPNFKICRRHADNILDFKNFGQSLDYTSSIGVSNIMGMIMGTALIIFGLRMFFDKQEPQEKDEIEEEC